MTATTIIAIGMVALLAIAIALLAPLVADDDSEGE